MLMMLPPAPSSGRNHWGSWFCKIWGVGGAMWPEIYPADAHDAPTCPVKWMQSLGQLVLQDLGCRGRHVAGNMPS